MTDTPMPPHDLNAEQTVLGSALVYPECCAEILRSLRKSDFYSTAHRTIFSAIERVSTKVTEPDAGLVLDDLRASGDMEKAGGEDAVLDLGSRAPTRANIRHYVGIVLDSAVKRGLLAIGQDLQHGSMNGTAAVELIRDLEDRIEALKDRSSTRESLLPQASSIFPGEISGFLKPGIPTGFTDLDRRLLGGWRPGIISIEGESGLGKSLLANQFMQRAASAGAAVLWFPFEDSPERLVTYMVARGCQVNSAIIAQGTYRDAEQRAAVERELVRIRDGTPSNPPPLARIHFASMRSLADFRRKVRMFASLHAGDPMVLGIDPLHVMPVEAEREVDAVRIALNEVAAVTEEFGFVTFATMHMNAEGRARGNHSIGHRSTVKLLLEPAPSFEDTYLEDMTPLVHLGITKNKNAETGRMELRFEKAFARFLSTTPEGMYQ